MIRAEVDPEAVRKFVIDFLGEEFVDPTISYYRHRKQDALPTERKQELIDNPYRIGSVVVAFAYILRLSTLILPPPGGYRRCGRWSWQSRSR
jgi:hypothetical protein